MSYQRPSFWHYRANNEKKKVAFGSPADGTLNRGDIITKIGSYDARDIRHQDAQNLFNNAGNNIRVVVQRQVLSRNPGLSKFLAKIASQNRESGPGQNATSTGSSRASSRNYNTPLSISPHLSSAVGGGYGLYNQSPSSSGVSPGGSALTPIYTTPLTPIDAYHFTVDEIPDIKAYRQSLSHNPNLDEQLVNQPYRTTPLVLPGAKVKHEPTVTESYLRHHPNPAVRARPHQLDTDYLLKQKVTNTVLHRLGEDPNRQFVHKQFNSPIGLYSDANVADTIHRQTGGAPSVRRPMKYNPADSETYRAVQEENYGDYVVQEQSHPAQSRVYTPNKNVHNPTKKPVYQLPNTNNDDERIHQSGSFKRIMWSVMGDY